MEMSDVQAFWAQFQLLWAFPRNHAQGLQQEHQSGESPFNRPLNSQPQQTKVWGRAVIILHHKRISRLTNRIYHGFPFKSAHSTNTYHVI